MSHFIKKLQLEIDGNPLENNYTILDVSLVQELQKPTEFRFFLTKNTPVQDSGEVRFSLSGSLLGKTVNCFLTVNQVDKDGNSHEDSLSFSGIIFNVNALRSDVKAGLSVEVTAYSPDCLLLDSPHCYSYESKPLNTIVSETVNPYKIPMKVNPGMTRDIPYTVQYNENNYAFLSRLASRYGEWLYYNGQELVFGKIEKKAPKNVYLSYDILHYQYRLDVEHPDFVRSHHDYMGYKNTKSGSLAATGMAIHNMTDIAYNSSKSIYKKQTFSHTNSSFVEGNFDEIEHSVKAHALGRKAQMMMCHGSSIRADFQIGSVIRINEEYQTEKLKKASCTHDELLVVKVKHTLKQGCYENEFCAIPEDCKYPPYVSGNDFPYAGTQRAVVKDNQDPEKLGRVRVQFLWQQEQQNGLKTPWIRIAQPHGGDNKGIYFIPEIDEEVMVGFENGNAEKPYVIGTLYHGKQHPGNWYSDKNDIKAIRTRSGHTIEFHDTEGTEHIKIYDNGKNNFELTFSTHEQLIKLESKGDIELHADKNIMLDAGENVTIQAGKNISETATDNVSIDAGKNMSANAGKDMVLDAGGNMTESAGKNLTVSASNNAVVSISKDLNLQVDQNMDSIIGKSLYIDASKKFNLKSDEVEQVAGKKLNLYADKITQKADSSAEILGGMKMEIKSSNTNIK